MADLGSVIPNYVAGVGPAYLSGQDSWYSGEQLPILMVDSKYSGPLLVRAFELGGDGKSTVTLADLPSVPYSKPGWREAVVPALHTTGGGMYLGAVAPTPSGEPGTACSAPTALDALGFRWTETRSPSSSCSWSTPEHRRAAEPQL